MIEFSAAQKKRLKARHRREARFQFYGKCAIFLALLALAFLFSTILSKSLSGFQQTYIILNLDVSEIVQDAEVNLERYPWPKLINNALAKKLNVSAENERALQKLYQRLSVKKDIRQHIKENAPEKPFTFALLASDKIDQVYKDEDRFSMLDTDLQTWYLLLKSQNALKKKINWSFFTNSDSTYPELAGIKGAFIGSFYTLIVTFLFAFPLGIMSGVYLESFAKKNKLNAWIEVNINNLAAVPSIIYGLLGLAFFLQIFGFPRSSPLVGGLVLGLMTLPTIIITTRVSLKSIPPSIKQAALALGASPFQATFHHMVPLALPGILTGTIIGMARALGETAPLIMIGMVAFITTPPSGFLSPSSALPVQIYLWADKPELGFAAKTSALILVLLVFLLGMNGLAVYLRRKFEKKW